MHKHTMACNAAQRYDPTGTLTLRARFVTDMNKRFAWLKGQIRALVVDADAFGLGLPNDTYRVNVQKPSKPNKYQKGVFAFKTDAQKHDAFMEWLDMQVSAGLLDIEQGQSVASLDDRWSDLYVTSAYRKGLVDGYIDANKALGDDMQAPVGLGYMSGQSGVTAEAFMRSAFARPMHANTLALLFTRTFNDLKGVTQAMDTKISRSLAQGLADGRGPRQIASALNKEVDLGLNRARVLARTEIIRAHSESKLNSFEELGIFKVEAEVEWLSAGDSRVCPICRKKHGGHMTTAEARGMIPIHPQCRCTWRPYMPDKIKPLGDFPSNVPYLPGSVGAAGHKRKGVHRATKTKAAVAARAKAKRKRATKAGGHAGKLQKLAGKKGKGKGGAAEYETTGIGGTDKTPAKYVKRVRPKRKKAKGTTSAPRKLSNQNAVNQLLEQGKTEEEMFALLKDRWPGKDDAFIRGRIHTYSLIGKRQLKAKVKPPEPPKPKPVPKPDPVPVVEQPKRDLKLGIEDAMAKADKHTQGIVDHIASWQDGVPQLNEKIDDVYTEMESLFQQRYDALIKSRSGDKQAERDFERLDVEYNAARQKKDKLYKDKYAAQKEVERKTRELIKLPVDERMDLIVQEDDDPYWKSKTGKRTLGRAKEAQEFAASLTSAKTQRSNSDFGEDIIISNMEHLAPGDRAYSDGYGIFVSAKNETHTHVHELGHVLEKQVDGVRERCVQFLDYRTVGETARKLKDVTGINNYDEDEYCKPDKFFRAYCGKVYSANAFGQAPPTEILSMGIQRMHEHPVQFARDDPEYFKFIIGVLRGWI